MSISHIVCRFKSPEPTSSPRGKAPRALQQGKWPTLHGSGAGKDSSSPVPTACSLSRSAMTSESLQRLPSASERSAGGLFLAGKSAARNRYRCQQAAPRVFEVCRGRWKWSFFSGFGLDLALPVEGGFFFLGVWRLYLCRHLRIGVSSAVSVRRWSWRRIFHAR